MNLEEIMKTIEDLNTSAFPFNGAFVRLIEPSGHAPAYAEIRFPTLLKAGAWVVQWGTQDSAMVVRPVGTPMFNQPVTVSFNLETFSENWNR